MVARKSAAAKGRAAAPTPRSAPRPAELPQRQEEQRDSASRTAPSPPPPPPPLAIHEADVHYFDTLHPVVLSHIRRGNSDGVLALLSLPQLTSSRLFWRTCTYTAGIVAAVLSYVVEHTAQQTVPAHDDTTAAAHDDAAAWAGAAFSPPATSAAPRLSVDELYALLCLCTDAPREEVLAAAEVPAPTEARGAAVAAGRHPPALAALLERAKAVLLHLRRGHPHGTAAASGGAHQGDLPELSGLNPFLTSTARRLRALMHLPPQTEAHHAGVTGPAEVVGDSRKRQRAGEAPNASATGAPDTDEHGEPVRLAALAAALQLQCSTLVYENPLGSTSGAPVVNPPASPPPAEAADTRNSPSAAPLPTAVNLATTAPAAPQATAAAAARAVRVEETTDDSDAAEDGELDAVSMLRRVPAISATRWAVPHNAVQSSAAPAAAAPTARGPGTDDSHNSVPPTCLSPPSASPGASAARAAAARDAAARLAAAAAAKSVAQRSGALAPSQTTTSSPPPPPSTPPSGTAASGSSQTSVTESQAQREDERARVSAAIRAFDAFTTALEQQQQHQQAASTSAASSASRTPNAPTAATTTAAAAAAAAAAASGRFAGSHRAAATPTTAPSAQPLGGPSRARTSPASLSALPAAPTTPATTTTTAPTAPTASAEVRRRHKFSAAEDAAILHGIARFGRKNGSFQYIYHAYRTVWLAGRTPLHLYDHWRGALRRRAVVAMGDEEDEAYHLEGVVRPRQEVAAASGTRRELSSEIEELSDVASS